MQVGEVGARTFYYWARAVPIHPYISVSAADTGIFYWIGICRYALLKVFQPSRFENEEIEFVLQFPLSGSKQSSTNLTSAVFAHTH